MEVLYPFCYPSLFPPLRAAKNFSGLFQIFIFLAVALCWRDKLFSPASLALRRTRLNIYLKKNHFYLKPLIFPRISFKGMSQNPLRWRMSVPVRADEKENRRFAETQDNFCSEVCERSSRIDLVCVPCLFGLELVALRVKMMKEGERKERRKNISLLFQDCLHSSRCVTCAVSSWLCLIWGIKPKKYH